MNIFGKALIFRNEINGRTMYKTSISNVNMDGQKEYMQVDVQLPKDTQLHNKTMINILKGFDSFWTGNDGQKHLKYVVLDFQPEITIPQSTEDFSTDEGSDLPF